MQAGSLQREAVMKSPSPITSTQPQRSTAAAERWLVAVVLLAALISAIFDRISIAVLFTNEDFRSAMGTGFDPASFWARAAELGYRTEDGGADQAAIRQVLKARGYGVILPSKVPDLLRVLREEWEAAHSSDIDQSAGAETEPQSQVSSASHAGWQVPRIPRRGPTAAAHGR